MTTQVGPALERVRDYYCSPRADGDADRTIYEIWEHGGAFNDSVTPSTYVPEYRAHIGEKIVEQAAAGSTVFSLGCGNGFVEGDLVRAGYVVRAIDCNDEAVLLSRHKGVDAYTADYFALGPADLAGTSVVYADGLLGHLFDPDLGLDPALAKLTDLGLAPGTSLVLSNDSPRDPEAAFAPHERVEGFWFVSKKHLGERLAAFGFDVRESYYFRYLRPISGPRNRTICVARVP